MDSGRHDVGLPHAPSSDRGVMDEVTSMLLPCVQKVLRTCLAEEFEALRKDVASLAAVVQSLREGADLRGPSRAWTLPHSSNTAPPESVSDAVSADHSRKFETGWCVQTQKTEQGRSAASSQKGSRVIISIPNEAEADSPNRHARYKEESSSKSLSAKRSPSVQELEALRAQELLGSAGLAKSRLKPVSVIESSNPASPDKTISQIVPPFAWVSQASGRPAKTETLRQSREAQLVSVDDGHPLDPVTSIYFSVSGILPWNHWSTPGTGYLGRCGVFASAGYQLGLFAIMLGSVTYSAMQVLLKDQSWLAPGLVSDLSIAFGGMASLIAVGALRNNGEILACLKLLTHRTWNDGCLQAWLRDSRQEHLISLCVWIFAVISRAIWVGVWMSPDWHASDTWLVLSVLPFALCSGVVLAVASCMMQICLGLAALVDVFSSRVVEGGEIRKSVHHWNVLQAMIRQACMSIQRCFLLLHGVVTAAALLAATDFAMKFEDIWETASLIPLMIIIVAITRVFFNAAEVTNKCGRVPALINSLDFGKSFDEHRQYIVNYVIQSAAGFYAYEVRITSFLALKWLYLSLALALALANELAEH